MDSRILPALGHLKLSELTAPIIQTFLNSLKGPGMRHPMHVNSYNTWLKKFLSNTDLPKSSIHKLRHAFGTYQIAAGVDWATVKDAMGHADLRTTSLYVKALDSRKRLITSTGEATIQRLRDSVKQDDDQSNKDPQ